MHLHSFAWWIAAVFAARAFFRQCVSPRAAVFATVIFALAPCHALPIGWLANREALLAITFGTIGLSALLRWQDGGSLRWAMASLAAFTLALLAGEYALGCAGFVVAFAWRAPRRDRRVTSLLLFAFPAVGYLVARRALGYGAEASGFYQDPLRDTGLFAAHVPWRLLVLTLAGWFSQDSTAWRWGNSDLPVVCAVAAFLAGGRAALRHVASQLAPPDRSMLWSLVVGSFLAIFPVLAVLPSVRLLGVATLGIAAVVGVVLDAAWFGRETEARSGPEEWTAIAATLLGFAHLVHGPGRAWLNGRQIQSYAIDFADHTAQLATRLTERAASDVIVVRGLDDVFFYGFALEGKGVKGTRWTVLAHTGHVLCRREDARSLELLVAMDSAIYPATAGDLYRSELHPLRAGDAFSRGGLVASVKEMDPAGPRRVRFTLEEDLDDPRYVWVGESRSRGFYDALPPKVGFGAPLDP
jgi:hypothetical protein